MKKRNKTLLFVGFVAIIGAGYWFSQLWGTGLQSSRMCLRTLSVPWHSAIAVPCDWSFCEQRPGEMTESIPFASIQKKPTCLVGLDRLGPEGSPSDTDIDFTYFTDQREDFSAWLNERKRSLESTGLLFQMAESLPNGADAGLTAVDTEGRFDSRFPYVLQKFYWQSSRYILEVAVYIPKLKYDGNQESVRQILESMGGVRASTAPADRETVFSSWTTISSILEDFRVKIPSDWSSSPDIRGSTTSLSGPVISETNTSGMLNMAIWYEQLTNNTPLQDFAKRHVINKEDVLQEKSLTLDGHEAFRTLVKTPSSLERAVVQYVVRQWQSVIVISGEVNSRDPSSTSYSSDETKIIDAIASTFQFVDQSEIFSVVKIPDGATVLSNWKLGYRMTLPNGWDVLEDDSEPSSFTLSPPTESGTFSVTLRSAPTTDPSAIADELEVAKASDAETVTISGQNEVTTRTATELYSDVELTTFIEHHPLFFKFTARPLSRSMTAEVAEYHDILSQILVF